MSGEKVITVNKKAGFLYNISEKIEAGIVLSGTEIKSIRKGSASIKESFAKPVKGEMFIFGMHIAPYDHGNIFNKDPLRPRKLLLHKKEIDKLLGKVNQDGMTIVPTRLYYKRGRVKVELGVGKGKNVHDKREAIKKRDDERNMQRAAARV
jgi:SsrA-binding protein